MLLYQPPFLQVDELTLFPDHADPETMYYVVNVPEIARVDGAPFLRGTALVPAGHVGTAADGGGQLRTIFSCDVELPARAETLARAREALKERWGKAPERLVGAPVSDGTCEIRYATTEDGAQDVTEIVAEKPGLVGAHRTAFTMSAEGTEAEILLASLQQGNLAATVAYSLQVPALRPAFEARMHVDWARVYKSAQERTLENFVFVSQDIERFSNALQERQIVEVEIDVLDSTAADQAARALFDELRQQMMEKMFQPHAGMERMPLERSIGNGVRDGILGIWPGKHYVLRRIDATTLKTATIDLSQRAARPMTVAPQSSLSGMIDRAGGTAGRIRVVQLGDLPTRTQRLLVEVEEGLAELGVRRVEAQVTVLPRDGGEAALASQIFTFQPGEARTAELRWLGQPGQTRVRHEVRFDLDRDKVLLDQDSLQLPAQEAETERLYIAAGRHLDVRTLTLEVEDPAVFDNQGQVDVQLTVHSSDAPERQRTLNQTFSAQTGRRATLRFVVAKGAQLAVEVTETFRQLGAGDLVRRHSLVDPHTHRIANPFGRKWSLRVSAIADWDRVQLMMVRARVYDRERRRWIGDMKDFTAQQRLQTFVVPVGQEAVGRAQLSATVLETEGSIGELHWREVSGPLVALAAAQPGVPSVTFAFDAPGFDAGPFERVFVFVSYTAADGQNVERDFAFERDGQLHRLELAPGAAPGSPVAYTPVGLGRDGARVRGARGTSRADSVTIRPPG